MKKNTINEARQTVISCAKQYEKNLLDKKLLIIYKDRDCNEMKFIEVLFLQESYQHLTGLELVDEKGHILKGQAKNFYRKCISQKLSNREIQFKKDGTTHLKLPTLSAISKIHSITKIAGDYNWSKPYLVSDKMIGNNNFCLGLKELDGYYVPKSALMEDIKKVTTNQSQVIAIFVKEKNDLLYQKIKYVAKGVNLKKIVLPNEIRSSVSLEKYIEPVVKCVK